MSKAVGTFSFDVDELGMIMQALHSHRSEVLGKLAMMALKTGDNGRAERSIDGFCDKSRKIFDRILAFEPYKEAFDNTQSFIKMVGVFESLPDFSPEKMNALVMAEEFAKKNGDRMSSVIDTVEESKSYFREYRKKCSQRANPGVVHL